MSFVRLCHKRSVTEQGLPYLTRQERHKYANLSDEEKTRLKVAQKKAATLESTTNSVRITLGLISMLLIGYISDRFGRRVALGVLLLGEILHISTMSIIVIMNLNVWLLILAGFFEAFFGGGLLAIYAQVAAVVVDVTRLSHAKAAERGKEVTLEKINQETWIWFTVFECLAFLCASSGSPIGGTIIYRYGFKAVVITCASLFIPSLIIIFILPETNKAHALSFAVEDSKQSEDTNNTDDDDDDETRTIEMKPEWKEVLVAKLKVVKHLDPLLIIIIIIVILLAVAAMVDLQYLVIYLMGAPFLWNPQQVGLYIGVSDLLSSVLGVTYTIIVVKIQQRRRAKEESAKNNDHTSQKEITSDKSRLPFLRHMRLLIFTLAGTLLLLTINKIMMGIAHQFATETANTIAYIATIPRLSKSLLTPIARSMFVLCTPQSNQGMIQSFGGFVARIGFLISLVALPAIYAATVTTFPPTVFIVVSGILILTILIDLSLLLPLRSRKVHD
ncbi:adenylate cyclase [Schistosoma japonicum]|uniref:Adenylate cyclase n=1 Tax=Schistosoma japonicum TaxID=6182 RepID=A0A4Z2CQP7_SCHJA|nr:adenylate cyclase [Schistosoma japonicum]TNN06535.1 adenylate cyclase [Schistosoma japonicum]